MLAIPLGAPAIHPATKKAHACLCGSTAFAGGTPCRACRAHLVSCCVKKEQALPCSRCSELFCVASCLTTLDSEGSLYCDDCKDLLTEERQFAADNRAVGILRGLMFDGMLPYAEEQIRHAIWHLISERQGEVAMIERAAAQRMVEHARLRAAGFEVPAYAAIFGNMLNGAAPDRAWGFSLDVTERLPAYREVYAERYGAGQKGVA